ncbi:MAG: reactive intermediate/imine deaminase [Candidatus Eremiobacteraeota bacterium]|nr:reactive intermediate/imine deaminase [Candidatus Eremiobacteraeota bacterium]MBV9973646.1 reactive intermediate/imine deaminase [Candidatus Eremiobacteraeota bacterium]
MKPLLTPHAPQPIGPYSQAVDSGNVVFCSGQVAIVPQTGKLLEGDAGAQTEQALRNISEILKAGGLSYADVVKTTIFLVDMSDFPAVNAAYVNAFAQTKPARSTVAVAGLPLGAKVEIEAIAIRR